jgi:hypothetical protein
MQAKIDPDHLDRVGQELLRRGYDVRIVLCILTRWVEEAKTDG